MLAEKESHIVYNWIRDYSDVFYDYLCKRISDTSVAKDILQETFIAAWKNSDGFQKKSSEKTWLFSILKNKMIDYYRQDAKVLPGANASYYFDELDHWTEHAAPQDWQSVHHSIDKKDFYSVLQKCNSKLTTLQRQAFSMKYMDDLDADYICKVLKISASNYWVLIHRSKLELRSCLTKNWFGKK